MLCRVVIAIRRDIRNRELHSVRKLESSGPAMNKMCLRPFYYLKAGRNIISETRNKQI